MITPLPYIGGKNRLAKRIISLFPAHTTYAEPFAGGASLFFRKEPSPVEVINDLDGDLVNFYRVCQNHYGELVRFLRYTLASRHWYHLLKSTSAETLTDIQKAARTFYLQKNSWAGLRVKQNYHYSVTKQPNFNPKRVPEIIRKAHERLQGVQIESLPYGAILDKYDRPATFFYLDPPYWASKLYKFNFTEADFSALEARLRRLRGKFILSLNDTPEVRRIFSFFPIDKIGVRYTAQRGVGKTFDEVIIRNFEVGEQKKDHERPKSAHS